MLPINIIRCYGDRGWGEDWWAEIFHGLPVETHVSADFSLVLPRSIYMINGTLGLDHVPAAFLEAASAAGPCALIHEGDEFYRGPYSIYRHFDLVLRNFPAPFLAAPGVMGLPVGYCSGMPKIEIKPASQRPNLWSFTGQTNGARQQMAKALEQLTPNRCHLVDLTRGDVHLPRSEFLEMLAGSAFMPCPMGNVQLETARLYEALEYGAIPLATRRLSLDYFERLFGPHHKIPVFRTWSEARAFAEGVAARPEALDTLQTQVREWWLATKGRLINEFRAFVTRGFAASFRPQLQRDFAAMSELSTQAGRFADLLAMQDAASLQGRAERALRNAKRQFWPAAQRR